jgi:hypothetical protein
MRTSPLMRRISCEALEHRGEMSLSLEANRQGDFHKRNFVLFEQFFGTLDPPLQQILMGPHACRPSELRGKVHSAQPGDSGQVLQRDLCREMIVYILEDTLETPFLQRPYVSTATVLGGASGRRGLGSPGIDLPAIMPGHNGQAQGIRTDFRVVIVRSFRGRKGVGKMLDDRVLAILDCRGLFDVFRTTSKALGRNLEAGNAVDGFRDIPILCGDSKDQIEMHERQRYAVPGEANPEIRSFETIPSVTNSSEVDRLGVDDMILGASNVRRLQRHGLTSLSNLQIPKPSWLIRML